MHPLCHWNFACSVLCSYINNIHLTRMIYASPSLHKSNTTGAICEAGILQEHLSLPSVFSGVRVAQIFSLIRTFCPISLRHCIFCPLDIFGFWLPLWYFPNFLNWQCFEVPQNTGPTCRLSNCTTRNHNKGIYKFTCRYHHAVQMNWTILWYFHVLLTPNIYKP